MATVVVPADTTKKLLVAFNRLAWSNLAAQIAEQISLAAAPIVAVLTLGAGAGETGLLQAAQTLPFLLLAIPAGILADRSVAFVAGPALGGLFVGGIGAGPTYAIATALSGIAVISLLSLKEPARQPVPKRTPLAELNEGARFVLTHQLLRPILVTAFFFNIAFFVLQAMYVPYAHRHLGLSAEAIGITLALYGAGMVVGASLAGTIERRLSFGRVILIGPFTGLAASLVMVVTIWVSNPLIAGPSFFLIGMGPMLWTISSTILRQVVTPDAMLGRDSALITTATWGARPIGATIGAIVGSSISLPACLLAAVIGFVT